MIILNDIFCILNTIEKKAVSGLQILLQFKIYNS